MVNRPASSRVRGLGDSLLSSDEDPTPRVVRSYLFPIQQLWMLGDQCLEFVLVRKRLLFQWLKAALSCSCVDAFGHQPAAFSAHDLIVAPPVRRKTGEV